MAGFYGNIRNSTSNSFKFDRIYSNRALMEKNANNDGIFAGRYVLVEYDQGFNEGFESSVTQTYYQFNDDNKYYSLPAVIAKNEEEKEIQVEVEKEIDGEITTETTTNKINVISFVLQNANNDTGIDNYEYGDNDLIIEIIKQKISINENDFTEDENAHGSYTYIKKYGVFLNKNNNWYYDKPYTFQFDAESEQFSSTPDIEVRVDGFLHPVGEGAEDEPTKIAIDAEEEYAINYAIDKYYFKNVGRGYDSTVWRKIYQQDGTAKYVNIAELNSVVPTFAVTADAPSEAPITPHFDSDSTNVYYNIHLQTPWGFRLAPIQDGVNGLYSKFIKENRKINEEYVEEYSAIGEKLKNIDPEEFKYLQPVTYEAKKFNDGRIEPVGSIDYYPAIYLNAAGFDKKYHHNTSGFEPGDNRIDITSTGKSNLVNYNHDEDAYDIKELSIILPVLGDTVSEMWDLMYGDGSDNTKNQRKDWIKWEDVNDKSPREKLHLITDTPDETGSYYTPVDYRNRLKNPNIDSLAGAINSVHDIMGMIITEDAPVSLNDKLEEYNLYKTPGDTDEFLYNSIPNQIYVEKIENENGEISHNFYYAGRGYAYQAVDTDFDPEANPEKMYELGTFEGHEDEVYDGYEKITRQLVNYKNVIPKQFIKENKYTLKLANDDVASAGTEYYNIPKKLQYAGILTQNAAEYGKTYYVKNGDNYEPRTYPSYKISTDNEIIADKNYYQINEETGEYVKYNGANWPDHELYEIDDNIIYYSVQEFLKVLSQKEPFLGANKEYYTYNRYKDEYQKISGINEEKWEELTATGDLYRKDTFAINHQYFVFGKGSSAGNRYYVQGRTTINGKTLYTYTNLASNELSSVCGSNRRQSIQNLKDLFDLINDACDLLENNNSDYIYTRNALFLPGASVVDYQEGIDDDDNPIINITTTTPYSMCRLDAFLFDYDLYEKINDIYVKATFSDNSSGQSIGPATGSQFEPPFYRITANAMTPYEDYRYVVFKSNDESIGQFDDSFMVKTSNGTYADVKNPQQEVIEDGIIETAKQSISNFWLSVNGFDENATYWRILDNNDNPIIDIDTISELFTTPAAYGVNNINVDSSDYADETIYYADNVLYTKNEDGTYQLASLGEEYESQELWQEKKLYVIDVGDFENRFKLYQEWNPLVIRNKDDFEHYFEKDYVAVTKAEWDTWKMDEYLEITFYKLIDGKYVKYEGVTKGETAPYPPELTENPFEIYVLNKKPLVLGKKVNVTVKRNLPGFARDLNTIHGLILKINEILQSGDLKTRDPETVQGCLNQMHDVFDMFDELVPGELYGINRDGKIASIGFEDTNNGESWTSLGTMNDANDESKKNLYVFHKTINEFSRDSYSADESRNTTLSNYITALANDLNTNEKIHDPFGFTTRNSLSLKSPVIDNAGHVVGEKTTSVKLADLLLEKTGNDTTIATLTNETITTSDSLSSAFSKLAEYVNNSADNVTLTNYNNYYDNAPYFITDDTTPQEGKTYYVKDGDTFIVYAINPWPSENKPVIYEKNIRVDNNDNINEAIAKLQSQINEHNANQLISVSDGNIFSNLTFNPQTGMITATKSYIVNSGLTNLPAIPSGYVPFGPNNIGSAGAISDSDTVGTGLVKLQAQITNLNQQLNGTGGNTGLLYELNNYFSGIVRAPDTQVPSSYSSDAYYDARIRSGWIWIDTTNHRVYIKTNDGYKNSGYTNAIDQNYWELLNAWQ